MAEILFSSLQWIRSTCGVFVVAKRSCHVEAQPFSSWQQEPSATSATALGVDQGKLLEADTWYRFVTLENDGLASFVFYPTRELAQVQYGERLPFFV